MNETQAVLFAVGIWIGAWAGAAIERSHDGLVPVGSIVQSLAFGVGMLASALLVGRPRWLVPAGLLFALVLGVHTQRSYRPLEPGPIEGLGRLVTDPSPYGIGAQAELRLDDGRRVRLVLAPPLSWDAERWAAGEQLYVEGRLQRFEPTPWARSRHLVGSLNVEAARRTDGVRWWMMPSNEVRSLVHAAGRGFAPEQSALYRGLVIGDDRDQSIGQQARFRAAGLSHLLAVSGQNVAFVLMVAGPALRRFGFVGRLVGIGLVLTLFAVATRLEPSVLRATFTAGVAAWAIASGRRATGLHSLALAVSGLILIDPFLVDALGFRLSVAASLGILVLGPAVIRRMRGPRWLAEATGTTIAAQAAVLPLILVSFGPVSLITVPANVLAGWAAGLVMTWGMSVGLIAGGLARWLGAPSWATAVQLPAGWAVSWVDGVARWAARVPAPLVNWTALGAGVALLVVLWTQPTRRRFGVGVALTVAALGFTMATAGPAEPVTLRSGAVFWPAGTGRPSVLVVTAAADRRLLEELLESDVRSVDVLVLERGDRVARPLALETIDLLRPGLTLAPPDHVIRGATALLSPATIVVAEGAVQIEHEGRQLRVFGQ